MTKQHGMALLLILMLFSALFFLHDDGLTDPGDEEGWRERIQTLGGKAAYEEFAMAVNGMREETQHTFVHLFASVLYEEEGLTGFSVCDSRFFYGCFHEFVARALEDYGTASAKDLNQTCLDELEGSSRDACQHGIGHGLQTLYGYAPEDLDRALTDCKKLPYNSLWGGGCYGGIYMEYNLRTMLAEDGEVREEENLLAPCDGVAREFQAGCVYWQPQWWRSGPLFQFSTTNTYEDMGTACRTMSAHLSDDDKEYALLRSLCVGGVGGLVAPETAFDPSEMISLCDAVAGDEQERIICLANAGYRALDTISQEAAIEVCAELSGNAREYCTAYVASDYARYAPLAEELGL